VTGQPVTSSVETFLCTVEGADHDFRPRQWRTSWNTDEVSWVCVWCDGIACGNLDQPDPCWLIYHHGTEHSSRAGVTWPIGGQRQSAVAANPPAPVPEGQQK
jgi:hypothetical protein